MPGVDDSPAESFTIAPRPVPQAHGVAGELPDHLIENSPYVLYVRDRALIAIRQHARSDPEHEVGGVLFGVHSQRGERTVVEVRDILPLRSASTSRVHFTFDASAVLDLHRSPQPRDGSYLVGWFHSHVQLGDPFMSPDDLDVHQSYFKQPWYVSCVVDGGEWSMPVGFWRMDGNLLIPISEHYLQMTAAEIVGDQTRRFFHAAVEERPLDRLLNEIPLFDQNVLEEGPLREAFSRGLLEATARPRRATVMGAAVGLMDLALTIAEDPMAVGAVHELIPRLERIRILEDSLTPILHAEAIGGTIALFGNHCYSVTPGAPALLCADLVSGLIWRIPLDATPALVDLAVSPQGALWLITADGTMNQIAVNRDDETIDGTEVRRRIEYRGTDLPKISGEPKQIVSHGDEIYLRTTSEIIRFHQEHTKPHELLLANRFGISAEAVLIENDDSELGIALVVEGEKLRKLDGEGQPLGEVRLDEAYRGRALLAAGCSTMGLMALFDGVTDRPIAVFDSDSLELSREFLDSRPAALRQRVSSLAFDGPGRVFMKRGYSVWLFVETGTPDRDWYLSKP